MCCALYCCIFGRFISYGGKFMENIENSSKSKSKLSILTLLIFAAISGVLWRVEVQLNGWEGLKWISYFHWAIPIGIILFALWLAVFSAVSDKGKRLWLGGLFLLSSIPLYILVFLSFSFFFVAGPSAFAMVANFGVPLFSLLNLSILFIYPSLLVLGWFTAKRFGLRMSWVIYLLSAAVFLGAFPLAIFFIAIAEKRIDPDAIHAIKTGYVFPFMMIGLGIPFIPPENSID
jgi:hypothetical protein